jgi:hypothetical protein
VTSPVLEDTTVTNVTTYTGAPSINLPAVVDVDDHLLAVVAWNRWDGVLALTSAGWEVLYKVNLHAYHSWWILHKVADGTEDGGTITWATSGPFVIGGGVVARVSGAYPGGDGIGVAIAADTVRGYGTAPDPPAVTAPWGSGDQLYAALQTNGNTGATATVPSGYGSLAQTTVADGTEVAVAVLAETSASDDPPVYALSTSENYWAATVVFRDAAAAAALTGTPTGGIVATGEASAMFTTTAGVPVDSDVSILWDFDNDGDFNLPEEDITGYVQQWNLGRGRDYPSQLTGRAIPALFRATLNNDGDEFQPFNTGSPFNVSPLSLDSGRKLRAQINGLTTTPEPTRFLLDRMGVTGALDETEEAEPWSGVAGGQFTRSDGGASADADATAVVDARVTTGYYQTRVRHVDADNTVSIIYRWTNADNYGAVTVTPHTIKHHVVTGGTPTDHTSQAIEVRPHMSFGVLVDAADDVTVYLEGVSLFTDIGDAHNSAVGTDGTGWGIDVAWNNHRSPVFDEIGMWADLWARVEGVIFTGDVQDLKPFVTQDGVKLAMLTAEGWLTRLTGADRTSPPGAIGVTAESSAGVTTGLMIGQVLNTVGMLHPPPPGGLDAGDQTLGGVGTGNAEALFLARLFEDTELGFLHETNEGPLDFDDRSARAAKQVIAAFGDGPGSQFKPEYMDVVAFRREVFNRATAEVSPTTPVLETTVTTTGNDAAGGTSAITVTIPSDPTAEAGWLDLVQVVPTCQLPDEPIEAPTGWAALGDTGSGVSVGKVHWFAKKLTAGDLGDSVTFYDASGTGGGAWIVRQHLVSGWYGDVAAGVAVSTPAGTTGTEAQAGTIQPPTLLIPWGRQPCLLIATRNGLYTAGTTTATATDPDDAPNGYRGLDSDAVAASVATADVASQYAWRHAAVSIESPSTFGGTFSTFDNLESSTVAIRGYAGDPPEATTGELVTVDDLDSQARHNIISAYPRVAQFFPTTAAADTWDDLVLARHGAARPLFVIGFHANTSALHRYLAYTLRESDIVRVNATGRSGFGVNGLYHIEHVEHVGSDGTTKWWVEYQLSPVD